MVKTYKFLVICASLFSLFAFANFVNAQGVLPPMPTDYGTATPTAVVTEVATQTPVVYRATANTATATPLAQQVIDDAQTGPTTVLLIILSLIGGIGFILVKKYFDEKRYSL